MTAGPESWSLHPSTDPSFLPTQDMWGEHWGGLTTQPAKQEDDEDGLAGLPQPH